MGIPITTYTVLDSLALGGEDPHFRKLISPFNLFAFILGSPRNDPKLFATIDSAFDRLAFATGEKLLFFALSRQSNRRWGGERSNVYERLVKFQPASIGPDHEEALANALALGMGIPESALPCIVATTDLKSKDLVWFGTSAASVEEQLRSLGYLAWQHNRDQVKEALVDAQVSLDPMRPSGLASLDTSVAQAIADVLSFPVYRAGRSDVQNATNRARETLGGILNSIKEQKRESAPSPDDEPDPALLEKLESNAYRGLSCLSLLSERPDLSLFPSAPPSMAPDSSPLFSRSRVEWERAKPAPESLGPQFMAPAQRWPNLRQLGEALEVDSVRMLKTALVVQDIFESQPEIVKGLLVEQLDYTPTVICLAKVFEKEANLSVVHWIREHLRISLPPYFNKYQPGIHAVFTPNTPNAWEIDFNKVKDGIWIAPGLGQSEIACRAFGKTSLPGGWGKDKWSRLMGEWYVIRVVRNNAAHTASIDKESSMQIGEAIDRLAEHRIFESMCALKTKYRGF